MSIIRIDPNLIDNTGASDGDVLKYVSANDSVEFGFAGDVSNTWVNANDYATYNTLSGLVDIVQGNVTSLTSTVDNIDANTYNTYNTLTANIYNTFTYLNANVGAGGDVSNVWVNANDYNTYTTLLGFIDTVQDNVVSSGSSTSIVSGGVSLSNSTIFIESGDGITLTTNTTSNTLTITANSGAISSNTLDDQFIISTSNSFSLSQSVSNPNNIIVSLGGILQSPDIHYGVNGSTLFFNNSAPLTQNVQIGVRYLEVVRTGTVLLTEEQIEEQIVAQAVSLAIALG
jgi:hypothetical protein